MPARRWSRSPKSIDEPELQADRFDTRGYYGTLNHNAKAVYQHYFGWWGGVMSEYFRLPREQTAERYVAAMGGPDKVLALGEAAFDAGDYRWAAEVFGHVVFADADNEAAKDWLAATYEQLGFQAESGTWRSYFLGAAKELRDGVPTAGAPELGNIDFLRAVPSVELFNAFATRFNPAKLSAEPFVLQFDFPDTGEVVAVHVGPSTLVPRPGKDETATTRVTIDRSNFDRLALGLVPAQELLSAGDLRIDGEPFGLMAMFGSLDSPEFWFNTQTP